MVRSLKIVLLILCIAAFAAPVNDVKAADEGDAFDDVLRMLGEGVDSAVIVDWLARNDRPVRGLDPDDIIALSKAGASEALVQALLARSSGGRPARETVAPARSATADPPGAPQDGLAGLAVTLHYRSQVDIDERNKRWALFAYLDGEPLVWSINSRSPVKTARRIKPGKHVLHVLRESHLDWKSGWRHDSWVNLEPIEFTIAAGEGWHLSIDWIVKTLRFSDNGPLTWSLTRWSTSVAGATRVGTLLQDWPPLCDDVEANAPEGKKTPGWVKRDLRGCIQWADLWKSVPSAPDRDTVRAALEAVEFRPSLN